MAGLALAELEGLLRQGGVTIAPEGPQGVETIAIPVGDPADGATETFAITRLNQRTVTGVVTIYNTRTGEPREVDINALQAEMKKMHHDPEWPDWLGKMLYTLDKTIVPKYSIGTLLCPLNIKHPDWPKYRALGAQPCRRRGGLPHPLAVENHFRVKHRTTWANMERQRVRDLEDEERAYRRFQMQQAQAAAQVQVVTPAFVQEASDFAQEPSLDFSGVCNVCEQAFAAGSPQALKETIRVHRKEAHRS